MRARIPSYGSNGIQIGRFDFLDDIAGNAVHDYKESLLLPALGGGKVNTGQQGNAHQQGSVEVGEKHSTCFIIQCQR